MRLFFVLFIVFFSSINAFAEPNALLGEAIKKNLSIDDNLPQEDKLKAYQEIFNLTDKIISDYPGSDQTIKLLSNQKIGEFDTQLIRSNYINELTEYYDIICETSPNFLCLGFVSLKVGQSGCESSNDVRSIVDAHQNLKNAIDIFSSQQDDEAFVKLALDLYRSCLSNSRFIATDYSKDLFATDLVKILLKLNKEGTAKATIQNMKTPAFKVSGILALSEYQNKLFDRVFFERLIKFIKEDVKDINGSKATSSLALAEDTFRRSEFVIKVGDIDDLMRYSDLGEYSSKCDPFVVRSLVQRIFNFQYNVATLERERRGYDKNEISHISRSIGDEYGLDACRKKSEDTGEYSLSTMLYGNILLLSKESAKEFRRGVIDEDWTSSKQIDFAVATLGNFEDLFKAEYGLISSAKGSGVVNFEILLKSDRALFPVYKQIVNFGDVCESSKILFQRIKGREYYDDAIEYIINSESIDMNKKHECGDSELELLLN